MNGRQDAVATFLRLAMAGIIAAAMISPALGAQETFFSCAEGKTFRAVFSKEPEGVQVTVQGASSFLPAVRAASGNKYSDGRTTIWFKGRDGLVEVDGKVVMRDCAPVQGPALLEPGGFLFGEAGFGFTLPASWASRGYGLRVLPKAEASAAEPGALWMVRFFCPEAANAPNAPNAPNAKTEGRTSLLLEIAVFEPETWRKLAADPKSTSGAELASDEKRVWVAKLPRRAEEVGCRDMALTMEQVRRGFFTLLR